MVVLGPVAARTVTSVLGAPVAALRGITGSLARQNAGRNPRRTAATASALMVGVTVVALFTVVGASIKASAAHGVNRTLRADLVVDIGGYGGASGNSGLSPQLGTALARLPEVRTTAPIAKGTVLLAGHAHNVSIARRSATRAGARLRLDQRFSRRSGCGLAGRVADQGG